MGCGSVSHHGELGGPDAEGAQADRFSSRTRDGRGVNERRSRSGWVRFDHAGKEPQSVPEAACSRAAHSARTLCAGAPSPLRRLDRAQFGLGLPLGKHKGRGAGASSGSVPRRQSASRRALVAREISRLRSVRRESPTADSMDLLTAALWRAVLTFFLAGFEKFFKVFRKLWVQFLKSNQVLFCGG